MFASHCRLWSHELTLCLLSFFFFLMGTKSQGFLITFRLLHLFLPLLGVWFVQFCSPRGFDCYTATENLRMTSKPVQGNFCHTVCTVCRGRTETIQRSKTISQRIHLETYTVYFLAQFEWVSYITFSSFIRVCSVKSET